VPKTRDAQVSRVFYCVLKSTSAVGWRAAFRGAAGMRGCLGFFFKPAGDIFMHDIGAQRLIRNAFLWRVTVITRGVGYSSMDQTSILTKM